MEGKNPPKKIYLVWQGYTRDDEAYFNQYDALNDAVSSEHNDWEDGEVEVYEATPKLLGMFKVATKTVKVKKKK